MPTHWICLSCHLPISLFLFPNCILQPQAHSTCLTESSYSWSYICATQHHFFFFSLSSFRVTMALFISDQSMPRPQALREQLGWEVALATPSQLLTIYYDPTLSSMSHLSGDSQCPTWVFYIPIGSLAQLENSLLAQVVISFWFLSHC